MCTSRLTGVLVYRIDDSLKRQGGRTSRPSPTSGAATKPPSARCFASSCCYASSLICLAANCWQSTARASRRSITATAISPAPRWNNSSAKADERLADYLPRLDASDADENGTGGGSRADNLADKIAAIQAKQELHRSLLGITRPHRRKPDFADRPRQPGHGRPYQDQCRLQRSGRRRRQAQADRRDETVEHPFGYIKQWMNQGAFSCEGWTTCAPSSA